MAHHPKKVMNVIWTHFYKPLYVGGVKVFLKYCPYLPCVERGENGRVIRKTMTFIMINAGLKQYPSRLTLSLGGWLYLNYESNLKLVR